MEDYDYITGNTGEDLEYYDRYEVDDEPLYYDPHDYYVDDDDDVIEDDYYDERDDVMIEHLDGWENDDIPEVEIDFDPPQHGRDEDMLEASDDADAGEDFDGSDVDVHHPGLDSYEDENEESLDQGSSTLEDVVCGVLEDDTAENAGDDHSDLSCGSELDVYADARNGNYDDDGSEYIHSDYEEMDELDDDDPWGLGLMGDVPVQVGDAWDDLITTGEEWDMYYDGGDGFWDEEVEGRFELSFEDYAGEDAPVGVAGTTAQDPAVVASGVCPICLEQLGGCEVGNPWNCKHYFCVGCITEWVRRSNTCPVDREVVSKIAVRSTVCSAVTRVVNVTPAETRGAEED